MCTGGDSVPPPEPKPAVPDVRNLPEHEAVEQLELAGYDARVETHAIGACSSLGYVESQRPVDDDTVVVVVGVTNSERDCQNLRPRAEAATHQLIRFLRGVDDHPILGIVETKLQAARYGSKLSTRFPSPSPPVCVRPCAPGTHRGSASEGKWSWAPAASMSTRMGAGREFWWCHSIRSQGSEPSESSGRRPSR